jgi:putative DNA primase/helicase
MANNYYSRLARKQPILGAPHYPTAAEMADILGGKTQAGGYMCRCPGPLHRNGDRNPSLSVKDGRNGRPLFHCFAGCAYDEIVTALRAKGIRL